MSTHPYKDLERLPAWKAVERALTDLAKNGDLKELTARRYIVGYLVKRLSEASALRDKASSGSHGNNQRPSNGYRFRPDALHHHRAKLGLSAKEYGKLVGVSGLTIYQWEAGRAKPRPKRLATIAALLASN